MKLANKYNHLEVEKNRYAKWLEEGYFKAGDINKKPYTIVIPPPNVTGKLHLGHAWDNTLQDILARYHRLLGYDVLYLPGMDHAGIATQAKVDEYLRKQNISRYDIGREKFLAEAFQYKEKYAEIIHQQWAKLGLSLDYSRERFTLDNGLNQAVNKVFVTLYNQGLIYRGERIINWDVEAQTAISNIEVIYKEIVGHMYTFVYQVVDSAEKLLVATTRPETMFGDVCVVVNPNDERYQHLIGKKVINPANNDIIDIIADEYVSLDFGTGAMKCTPAHDPNDFIIGEKYHLAMPKCINDDGTMNDLALSYAGLDRFVCRKQLVADLEAKGLCVEIKEHVHQVGHSERTDSIVEPMLSKQWFVKMKPLAQAVLDRQAKDPINFVPSRFEKTFTGWLENIEDWTISRQLWWGHRIPAYTHKETGELVVSEVAPADIENYTQDEDVLDTWFSSALWPFSTLGWPNETADDFKRYYPTDVMVTGYDIILFWVVRMAFQGIHFTNLKPFKDVLIHGLIRANDGRKMSKSLGNGIDPMDVIEEKGVDALRFFLISNSSAGQDLRYDETKVEAAWNFINKIYNSTRFVLMYLPDDFTADSVDLSHLSAIDRWIISKMNQAISEMEQLMANYEFTNVGTLLNDFIWNDFCSWYIELSKSNLQSDDETTLKATYSTLYVVLMNIIKMISPFMPFVAETLYLAMPHTEKSINCEMWPTIIDLGDVTTDLAVVDAIINIVENIRKVRVDYNIKPSVDLKGRLSGIEHMETIAPLVYKMAKLIISDECYEDELALPLRKGILTLAKAQLIDIQQEKEKLLKQLNHFQQEVLRGEKMLANESFITKANPQKVAAEQEKLAANKHQLAIVEKALENLKNN